MDEESEPEIRFALRLRQKRAKYDRKLAWDGYNRYLVLLETEN